MRVFRTFSTRISLYVILLTAVLFLTASVTVYKINYDSVRKEAVTNAFSQLRALNLEMENVLSSVSSAIDNMVPRAEIMAVENRDSSDFLLLLKDILRNTPQLKDIAIALEPYYYRHQKQFAAYSINEGDSIRSMMLTDPLYTYPYYDWYVIPRCTDSTYWTDPYIDRVWGNLSMCSYTAPLHDGNGQFIGVICASIETQWLTSKIDNIRLYDHSYNFIIGKAAGYIVHPDNSLIVNETIFSYALQTGNTALAEAGRRMIAGETGMSAGHHLLHLRTVEQLEHRRHLPRKRHLRRGLPDTYHHARNSPSLHLHHGRYREPYGPQGHRSPCHSCSLRRQDSGGRLQFRHAPLPW